MPYPDPIIVRRYQPTDKTAVLSLLRDLPALYAGSGAWLEVRLAELDTGRGECWISTREASVVGIAILGYKADGRLKLRTLYVDERSRGRGAGHALVQAASELWSAHPFPEVYLTHATPQADAVARLLAPWGFRHKAVLADRYGSGRDEAVLARPATSTHSGSVTS